MALRLTKQDKGASPIPQKTHNKPQKRRAKRKPHKTNKFMVISAEIALKAVIEFFWSSELILQQHTEQSP